MFALRPPSEGTRVRPQQIIGMLNDGAGSACTVRYTSGALYVITDPTAWWFMQDARVLAIIVDSQTTAYIDPMLVESIELRESSDAC